jgi:fluoroacetyl-CoA thioesterase
MKPSLVVGLTYTHQFTITPAQTVPAVYRESRELSSMPEVLATAYMVGLFEWACTELLRPHLDPGEGTLGTRVDFTHVAPTPPGLTVRVVTTLTQIDGRSLGFQIQGHDGIDVIGEGTHRRAVVAWDRFSKKLAEKQERARLVPRLSDSGAK